MASESELRGLVQEAYTLALGRGVDPGGMGTYLSLASSLSNQGLDRNAVFNAIVKDLSRSEEARLVGQIALERKYLDQYERPIMDKLAREEIAPEFAERLQDQLRRFQTIKTRAKEDLDTMVRGFVNSKTLLDNNPSADAGTLEVSRRRLIEDFNTQMEGLARREKIDFRELGTALGLGEIAFGGIAKRANRELGETYTANRKATETGRDRGFEDILSEKTAAETQAKRLEEDVNVQQTTFERDLKREQEATARKLTEQRLNEPALQRRQRLIGILGEDTGSDYTKLNKLV